MRKKVKDLRLIDSRKAEEASARADEVDKLADDCVTLYNELTAKSDDIISPMSIFVTEYILANPNVLVKDLLLALQNNNYPTDWVLLNPDQILDVKSFVGLIICSEKQGNRNA